MHLRLKLHPGSVCNAVTGIEVEVVRSSLRALSLRYLVSGKVGDLLLPPCLTLSRADGLWQHTCFELFLRRSEETSYFEFNFSPSGEWATYRFDSYRSGMEPLEMESPRIRTESGAECFELRAFFDLPGEGSWQIALSAVIEDKGERKSYWALAHPAGKADFHHPDSFICELS